MNTPENTIPATVEPKLTHREKLMQKYEKLAVKAAALTAEINAIVAEVSHLDALSNIAVGTEVVAFVGKGEKAASVAGVVVGVKDDEDGLKVYKVQYGVGFDADIAVVKQSNISLPAFASPEAHGYPE
jgi:hypothetical protein